MMLKVGSEYLDFNGSVEVERKIKLFEDPSTTDGDVSFQFEVEDTNKNTRLLGYPVPDSSTKRVYRKIECDLQDDSGVSLYEGFLRIEQRNTRTKTIALSFFSGNSNWFGMIEGNLSDLDFSDYDVEQTQANIESSWTQMDGLVFPLIDHGGLITRSYPIVKIEDFVGSFYVKTIFKRVFSSAGIKLQGELLNDWRFQNMICTSTGKDQDEIDARSSYVEKSVTQVVAHNVATKITWDNDSTNPYFDGSQNNFNLPNSSYDPDVRMNVKFETTLVWHTTGFAPFALLFFYVNGVQVRVRGGDGNEDLENVISFQFTYILNAGDVVEVYLQHINADGDAASVLRGTLKITPLYIYKTNGNSAVPNWTSQQFVSNVLKIFNVISAYDAPTATLTLNLFEKITEKEPIDLSEYLSEVDIDYTEFISDYYRNSLLGYTKVEYDELKEYNQGKYLQYGQGNIQVANDFLKEKGEILLSDFANPLAYLNAVFDSSLEKTNLIELEEGESFEFSDVADDGSGNAAFNVGVSGGFIVGDLVRIKDSTNAAYNGDWVVSAIPTTHIVLHGVPFDTAASGNAIKLDYKYSSDENVFLFINIPNYQVSKFSGTPIYFNNDTATPDTLTSVAYAYFDLINTGRDVNDEYKQGLAFGSPEDVLRYQSTMTQDYWSLVSRVLNDPVKPICVGVMPSNVYRSIDFLRPISIKTLETSNKYYCNLLSGYQSSADPFRAELIKLP